MLHGFTVPLTPQGKSALASPPPWHYSSDCLVVEYWADPAAIAALLPPGVTPDEKSQGRAFFWFLDWQFTASNDEITDPARYQYREAFVLVESVFERTPINYCPYIFVDNDAAIARGWAQGFPKKYGSIYQTRTFAAPSAAAAPLSKGSRFGASVAAHGERLATARRKPASSMILPGQIWRRSSRHFTPSTPQCPRTGCISSFRSTRLEADSPPAGLPRRREFLSDPRGTVNPIVFAAPLLCDAR
jgi:Acetoacetate decarboxylase (ADC)